MILAGGLGTRLRPLTETYPKPMVPVVDEPFLHWQIMDLVEQDYRDIILLVAYKGEQIAAHFGDGSKWGANIHYVFEQAPLGTGGAIRNATEVLSEQADGATIPLEEDFIVLNGDSFLPAPLDELAGFFDEGRFDAVVSTYDNGAQSGLPPTPVPNNLKVRNQMVVEYAKGAGLEKGYERVDSGIYIVKRSLFTREATAHLGERFQLEDVLHPLIEKRTYGAYAVNARFYDIGTVERLQEFEKFVRDERHPSSVKGAL